MRYVAKIYVLDVLDQVVVSGYCYDADASSLEGPPTWEFSYSHHGIGLDDDHEWLAWALYQACLDMAEPAARRANDGSGDGGAYIISGSGDAPI